MAEETIQSLIQSAEQIQNEVLAKANTASRVGGLMKRIINYLTQNNAGASMTYNKSFTKSDGVYPTIWQTDGKRLVGLCTNGTLIYTDDLIKWTEGKIIPSINAHNEWTDFIYMKDEIRSAWFATDNVRGHGIFKSTDGVTWKQIAVNANLNQCCLCSILVNDTWGTTMIVAGCNNSAYSNVSSQFISTGSSIMFDDGSFQTGLNDGFVVSRAIYAFGKFYIFSGTDSSYRTSIDNGITWTKNSNISTSGFGVLSTEYYYGVLYVTVGTSSTSKELWYSVDGDHWNRAYYNGIVGNNSFYKLFSVNGYLFMADATINPSPLYLLSFIEHNKFAVLAVPSTYTVPQDVISNVIIYKNQYIFSGISEIILSYPKLLTGVSQTGLFLTALQTFQNNSIEKINNINSFLGSLQSQLNIELTLIDAICRDVEFINNTELVFLRQFASQLGYSDIPIFIDVIGEGGINSIRLRSMGDYITVVTRDTTYSNDSMYKVMENINLYGGGADLQQFDIFFGQRGDETDDFTQNGISILIGHSSSYSGVVRIQVFSTKKRINLG